MLTKEHLDNLREAFDEWAKKHRNEFGSERKKEFVTEEIEITLKRIYTALDLEEKGFNDSKDLGLPGEYPFTRGTTATMGRTQPMIISQYAGFGSPEETNKLWKAMVAAGTPSILMAYDLPSQLGMDPDNPRSAGEVGRIGCSISSQRDWEIAWDGIDLKKLIVNEVYNAPAVFAIANHIVLGEKQGIPPAELRGVCQNDSLKEYYARGNYIFPVAQAMRLVGDILYYCHDKVPRYQAMQLCAVHQAECGANPVHEIAFAFADGIAYFQAAVDRGMDIDQIASGMLCLTGFRPADFFTQVAKHRAARRIWAKIMKERFKAKKPESQMLQFYSPIPGTSLFKDEYLNNIARGAISALGAVLAGCQFYFMPGYDEAYGIPTQEALLTSTQVARVATFETGCSDVVDPLGGSYYVEYLTSELEERIWQELETIDKRGGAVRCIEDGYFRRIMAQDAYKWQRKYESGDILRVGANAFRASTALERPTHVFRTNPEEEQRRRASIAELKKKRDGSKAKKALDEIRALATLEPKAENNLMPAVIEAVRSYATVEEVCDALKDVWGEYREPPVF